MGFADFKSVGGNTIAAGGSIPSPSAKKRQIHIELSKGGEKLAEADINLTAYSHYSG